MFLISSIFLPKQRSSRYQVLADGRHLKPFYDTSCRRMGRLRTHVHPMLRKIDCQSTGLDWDLSVQQSPFGYVPTFSQGLACRREPVYQPYTAYVRYPKPHPRRFRLDPTFFSHSQIREREPLLSGIPAMEEIGVGDANLPNVLGSIEPFVPDIPLMEPTKLNAPLAANTRGGTVTNGPRRGASTHIEEADMQMLFAGPRDDSQPTLINRDIDEIHYRIETRTVYVCTYLECNKTFGRIYELRRHYRSRHRRGHHPSDVWYICRVPGCTRNVEGFSRKDKRDDHERKAHRGVRI